MIKTEKELFREQRESAEKAIKKRLRVLKTHCRQMRIPFSITIDDLIPLPVYCPVFKIKLRYDTCNPRIESVRDQSIASFDKIIPNLGYVPGNVAIISLKANRLKNNASIEDLRAILHWMETVSP